MNESNDSYGINSRFHHHNHHHHNHHHHHHQHHLDDISMTSQPIMTEEMAFKDDQDLSNMLDISFSGASGHQHNFMDFH